MGVLLALICNREFFLTLGCHWEETLSPDIRLSLGESAGLGFSADIRLGTHRSYYLGRIIPLGKNRGGPIYLGRIIPLRWGSYLRMIKRENLIVHGCG